MRDLAVEQYHMVYPKWYGSALNRPRGECPANFTPWSKGKHKPHLKYAYHHSCLVSDSTTYLSQYHLTHVSSLQYNNVFTIQNHARVDRRKYHAYCTSYKMHTTATHNRGAGHPLDRGINLNAEDPEATDIDNEITHSSDATVALGGPKAEGHPEDPVYSNHDKLMALTREINDSMSRAWRSTTSREFGLQRMWNAKSLNSTSSTTSTHTYWTLRRSDTPIHKHCVYYTKRNKHNQLITTGYSCFNEYDSTKLEEWLTGIETAADLTNESWAKLAKAKSRGLTCLLVTEAINWQIFGWNKGFITAKTLQCWYPYIYLMLHGDTTVRKGIPCSMHPSV